MATLMRASLSRRSRILRDWTFLPSRPARGDVLMVKRMATVGSSGTAEAREHADVFLGADGVADGHVVHARDDDDVAGQLAVRDVDEAQALVGLQAGHAQGHGDARFIDADHRLVGAHRAVQAAAHGEAAEVFGVVARSETSIWKGSSGSSDGPGTASRMVSKRGERSTRGASSSRMAHGVAADGVEHREFKLFFRGVEIDEQVVDFVQHFLRAGVLAVGLADDHDE